MKSLLRLWQEAAIELAARCGTSTSRDFETVTARTEHEGLSFLTITLPSFCDGLQKGLADEKLERNTFPSSFRVRAGLPEFLRGFLALVFDSETGCLLDEPSIEAIYSIRQLTLMFGKINLPCSDARMAKAMDAFVQIEKEVKIHDNRLTEVDHLAYSRMSRMLWADVFSSVDRKVYTGELVPKHGPGATADRLSGNRKYDVAEWPLRLEAVFPYGEHALPSWRHYKCLDHVAFLAPAQERPVRVVAVPKTLKSPRIIAIEPTAMQYMQQAIASDLVGTLQSSDSDFGWLLGFTDQVPNQDMAREGSISGALATLDLSEASDRVSNQLVRRAVINHPWLAKGIDATRSRRADVQGHGVIRLAKYASMGSALTFPIEAIVFATVVMLGIESARGHRLSKKDVQSLHGQVRVYGDDIIVPVDCVQAVIATLELFGFKVNASKSFWTGNFRESCGKEYFNGEDVTVVRVREMLPTSRRDVTEVVSSVSLRNRCYMHGLWKTANYLDGLLEGVLRHYPTISPGAPVLGRASFLDYQVDGMHPQLHRPFVKGYVVKVKIPESKCSGIGALLKCFLSSERTNPSFPGAPSGGIWEQRDEFVRSLTRGLPTSDSKHLERLGRAENVSIKLGRSCPF